MAKKKSSSKKSSSNIVFRKHDHIGAYDAIEDQEFLQNCFIDTGDYEIMTNTSDHRSILLGRTGSGKTALIEMLRSREDRVIVIDPENPCADLYCK